MNAAPTDVAFPLSIQDVNALADDTFVGTFGDVAEHAPWVAEAAMAGRPFEDRAAMIDAFTDAIYDASETAQRNLLIAHPDLAGKAALAGELTAESALEQTGVGLDTLTSEEFARFNDLNDRYRQKFGIPFIFAVRGATKYDILRGFESRIGGDPETEFETALEQVERIVRFRLEDRVSI